tara:strand:+ start:331 stop:435 length:105 start_codon:yes stop_codon:yes gene_type:complete
VKVELPVKVEITMEKQLPVMEEQVVKHQIQLIVV